MLFDSRQTKWAARCRTAHVLTDNGAIRFIFSATLLRHALNLAANGLHGDDRSDGNQRSDQRVLDGGGALFVLRKTTENGQHWVSPKKKNVLLTLTAFLPVAPRFWDQ